MPYNFRLQNIHTSLTPSEYEAIHGDTRSKEIYPHHHFIKY